MNSNLKLVWRLPNKSVCQPHPARDLVRAASSPTLDDLRDCCYFKESQHNLRYVQDHEDRDYRDHDGREIGVLAGDVDSRGPDEDLVVEDDEDDEGSQAGAEEGVEHLRNDSEFDVSNLILNEHVSDNADLKHNPIQSSLRESSFPEISAMKVFDPDYSTVYTQRTF